MYMYYGVPWSWSSPSPSSNCRPSEVERVVAGLPVARVTAVGPADHRVESRLRVGGVLDQSHGTVGVQNAVRSLDHVSLARFPLALHVVRFRVVDRVIELVGFGRLSTRPRAQTARYDQCSRVLHGIVSPRSSARPLTGPSIASRLPFHAPPARRAPAGRRPPAPRTVVGASSTRERASERTVLG